MSAPRNDVDRTRPHSVKGTPFQLHFN